MALHQGQASHGPPIMWVVVIKFLLDKVSHLSKIIEGQGRQRGTEASTLPAVAEKARLPDGNQPLYKKKSLLS